jgi:tetratricopeptide (TPR) repeat protein
LTPKERALAAQRAAQRAVQTASAGRPDVAGLKRQVQSAVEVAKKPATPVADRLGEITRTYLKKIVAVQLPPVTFQPGSGEDEVRRAETAREEAWRRNPVVQEAEAERNAALAQLAAEAEAAQSTEHTPLAVAYLQLNRVEAAVRRAEAALAAQAADKTARGLLIRVSVDQDRRLDAVRHWRAGLEHNPADSDAQIALLGAYCSRHRVDDALTAYQLWLTLPVATDAVEAYLTPVRQGGLVTEFLNQLRLNGRLAQAEQAIAELSTKIDALEKVASASPKTASAKAVLAHWKELIGKAREDKNVPSR